MMTAHVLRIQCLLGGQSWSVVVSRLEVIPMNDESLTRLHLGLDSATCNKFDVNGGIGGRGMLCQNDDMLKMYFLRALTLTQSSIQTKSKPGRVRTIIHYVFL